MLGQHYQLCFLSSGGVHVTRSPRWTAKHLRQSKTSIGHFRPVPPPPPQYPILLSVQSHMCTPYQVFNPSNFSWAILVDPRPQAMPKAQYSGFSLGVIDVTAKQQQLWHQFFQILASRCVE
ncbi:Hypothetical predicted protein [Octopus vulgaris]|uniref:Uncharacterized protein n=1 Tax=Octopus vulgaris TaxID=6645 RepID=A0AA36FF29_OCTVU|nr:Hypothetical predicted protein [Octopus vulgaris]